MGPSHLLSQDSRMTSTGRRNLDQQEFGQIIVIPLQDDVFSPTGGSIVKVTKKLQFKFTVIDRDGQTRLYENLGIQVQIALLALYRYGTYLSVSYKNSSHLGNARIASLTLISQCAVLCTS